MSGPGRLNFARLAVVAAVADQHDEDRVLRRRLLGEAIERLADLLDRRLAA